MSRWHDQFENHAFRAPWNEFKKLVAEVAVDDETIVTSVAEVARLKKVTEYLDSLIESVDPEMIPMSIWDNFNAQLANCQQFLNKYISSRDINNIVSCNSHADNLLAYVRPFMVVPREALASLKRAASAYTQVAETYVESFGGKTKHLVSEIETLKNDADRIHGEIGAKAGLIRSLEGRLFGDGQSGGIEQKIEEFLANIEAHNNEINVLHDELLVGTTGELSTKKLILAAKAEIEQHRTSIQTGLAEVAKEIDEFNSFHSEIFGKPDKDTGDRAGGLEGDFQTLMGKLTEFESNQQKRYVALNEEIESLLPGATNAGLAKAYRDMKESFGAPIENASRLFYICVAGLVLVSLVLAIDSVGWFYISFIKLDDWTVVFKSLAYKLPFYGPIVWLAYFASKRRSESQRLQQEYAHKEALASSYNSYQKQIMALDEKDTEMRKELIRKVVDAIANNASLTLDGKHGDQMPFQDAIDLIAKNASKFKPI